jgi:hypothetical protein
MVKIKTLSFMVNCWIGNKDVSKESFKELCLKKGKNPKVSTNKEIDKAVNKAIADLLEEGCTEIIDVHVNYITTNRHNNGYEDTIEARYMILAK